MTAAIRRDYDPERDRCEEATLAQMALMVGPVQETVDLYRKAEAESEAAIDALAKCGVDVTKYLEAT